MAVTWQTIGAFATGTASAAPAFNTPSAGDLCILCCGFGNANDTVLDTPAGWTLIPNSTQFGGAGAYGVDSGNRGVMAFYMIAAGTEGTSTVTVSNNGTGTTQRVTAAQITRYTKTDTDWYISASIGTDNTSGTGYSVTAADVLLPVNGDQGLTITAWTPDTALAGTPTLTWDGVANTATQAQSVATTQGNDLRFGLYRRSLAGTGGSAPVFATTAGLAVVGPTAFILIHDGPAAAVDIPRNIRTSNAALSRSYQR